MALTSVWVGYGCIVDESLWATPFHDWFLHDFSGDILPIPFEIDANTFMIALATTTKAHAEYLELIELSPGAVFPLDEVTKLIPQERIDIASRQWSDFRIAAQLAGYTFPDGRLLFAHTYD